MSKEAVAKLEIEKLEQINAELIALINAERERQEKGDDVIGIKEVEECL